MAFYSTTFSGGAENPISEGGNWVSGPGGWAGMAVTAGGVAYPATAQIDCAAMCTEPLASNQYSEITLAANFSSSDNFTGCMVRIQSSTDGTCYLLYYEPGAPAGLRLIRVVDTAGTLDFSNVITTWSITGTPVAGDVIRLEARGTTLEGFLNGVSKGSTIDANLSGGYAGFQAYSVPASVNTGNFITAWAGGDFVALAPPFAGGVRLPMTILAR